MVVLTCNLEIISDLDLEGVGHQISDAVFGGAPFVGRSEYIFDEIPAVYCERPFFGERITLQGVEGSGSYFLEARGGSNRPPGGTSQQFPRSPIDTSGCIAQCLNGVKGLAIRGSFGGTISCKVRFASTLELDQLGVVISDRVLGSVKMEAFEALGSGDQRSFRTVKPILGSYFALSRDEDRGSFILEDLLTASILVGIEGEPHVPSTDISHLVKGLLGGTSGIQAH
jgi:hypothetical protein